jgi:hypothetical protein
MWRTASRRWRTAPPPQPLTTGSDPRTRCLNHCIFQHYVSTVALIYIYSTYNIYFFLVYHALQLKSFVWLGWSGIVCASLPQLCKRRSRWMWKAWPTGASNWAPSGREAPFEGLSVARRYILCSLSVNLQCTMHIITQWWSVFPDIAY